MKRWRVICAAALIFLTGTVTGALAVRVAGRTSSRPGEHGLSSRMMDARFDVLRRMQTDLNLSPEQSARIEGILDEGRKRTRQIWETFQPQLRDQSRSIHERIQAELTTEQRAKFDAQIKVWRERQGPRPGGDGRFDRRRGERGTNAAPAGTPPGPPPKDH